MIRNSGFTLIELMIVVAIVAVLAAVSLPIYQDYIARSQVSEALVAVSAVKVMITDYRNANAIWPPANNFQELNGGRYTATLTHTNTGIITVLMRNTPPVNARVRGFRIVMTPQLGGVGGTDIVNWVCTTPDNAKFLPSGCQ